MAEEEHTIGPRANLIVGFDPIYSSCHANARDSLFRGAPYDIFKGVLDGVEVMGWGYPQKPERSPYDKLEIVGTFQVGRIPKGILSE